MEWTGEVLLSDEYPDGLRPSAQLVGGRQDRQDSHHLRRPDNKLIRAPYLEYDMSQETVRFNSRYPWRNAVNPLYIGVIGHHRWAKFINHSSISRRMSARPSTKPFLMVVELNTNLERSLRSDADDLQKQRLSNLRVNYTKMCYTHMIKW